ncbi:hypothetical protein Mycch_4287 [Mycolicibacterium chubuense NBB4]|uniref:Uncharacterized protein n=1 Tax=Mycolicibacterium chubuense (strain NBB4) TaxID=710421 RepID=I4BNZ4_MYCCN|nr:hypothetical protein [Mycolicibacterium chubuense]AFM19001.1 hypothetical protein Mycch_4287 [Mycolicibacterium chubuense NBB4]
MERAEELPVAQIVPTPELVEQVVREKLPCWAWAVFASVVFHRWAAVEERKIRQILGSPVRAEGRLSTGSDVARFAREQLRAVDDVVAEVEAYLSAPAFAASFGAPGDEREADAVRIVRAAHHLGDCYERLLALTETFRSHSVPAQYAALLSDCTRFVNQSLQDFCGFVNDVLERLEDLQRAVVKRHRPVRFEPIRLDTTTDDQLLWSIADRLQAIC